MISTHSDSKDEDWQPLLESRRGALLRFFRQSARSQEDAEDMTQTTLLLALRFLPRLKAKEAASAWLNRIAANVVSGWRRPGYRRELTGVLAASSEEDGPDADKTETRFEFLFGPSPADTAETALNNIQREQMMAALRQLAPRDRVLLTLCYLQQLSHKEIGEQLDMNAKAVKVAVMRARGRLKELMGNTEF